MVYKKKTDKIYKRGVKFDPIDVEQVNLFRKYLSSSYKLAFTINKSFRPPCDSDFVSDIAVKYLEKAIAFYDITKNVKFETHLYLHLRNGFKSEIKRHKTFYKYVQLQHVDQILSESSDRPYLDSIPDPRIEWDKTDECPELIGGIRNGIGTLGQQIFDLMVDSEIVLEGYNQTNPLRKTKQLNACVISKILHKPRSSVHVEVKRIQNITKRVQERLKDGLPI